MTIFVSLMLGLVILVMYIVARNYPKRDNKAHLVLIYVLAFMTLFVTYPLAQQIEHTFWNTVLEEQRTWRHPLLFTHILLATPCTLFGPLLIFKAYRRKFPKHHRLLGKLYVFGVLLSAVLVLPLSMTNRGGIYARIGFSTMAVLWFIFTLKAYLEIRKRNTAEHERWMLRSYAMTFAFVHVNVTYKLLGVYTWVDHDPIKIKVLQSMVSWSLNLAAVEIYLRIKQRKREALKAKRKPSTS